MQRCSRTTKILQARIPELPYNLALCQQLRDRRHNPRQRRSPILHQPTVQLEIEPRHQTNIRTQPAAHGEANVECIDVRERGKEDLALAAAPVERIVVVQLVAGGDEVVVREHDGLGHASCAAGEEDGGAGFRVDGDRVR